MSEQPPYPSEPGRQDPDPNWAPPAAPPQYPLQPPGHPQHYQAPPPGYGQYPPQYYAPPRAYIPPGVTLASWGVRLAAYLIDAVLLSAAAFGTAVAVGFLVYGQASGPDADSAGWAAGVITYLVLSLLVFVLYDTLTMRRQGEHNGQTWAKQWLGIRVVREDGQPVTAGTALMRDVLMQGFVFGIVGGLILFGVPALLDGLWPLWDERNQTLHDKVANTFVIQA